MSVHGRFWLHVDGKPGPLAVRELVGRERANTLSRWTIDLEPGVAVDTHEVLDLRASLVIEGATAGRRVVHGHISRMEDRVAKGTRVTLEPAFARLRRTAMWRMFHGLDVITIATQVLSEHFITYRRRIKHAYPKLPHVAQRGESDYEFICRILAREGIFFYFDHPQDFATSSDETNSGSGDVLVLADHAADYPKLLGGGRLTHRAAHTDAMSGDDQVALALRVDSRPAPSRIRVQARDFRRPHSDLRREASTPERATEPTRGAFPFRRLDFLYEHDRDHEDVPVVDDASQRRLEAKRTRSTMVRFSTFLPHVMPGRALVVEQAGPLAERGLVVFEVRHRGRVVQSGGEPDYVAEVRALPAHVAMRPSIPPQKSVAGFETATVVGPAGVETHTDEHGRVQVRFHWDVEGAAPVAWLRVAQAWAGAGFGSNWLPRVGTEVLVGYVDGDPDRPIVTGSLHHVASPAPVRYPDEADRMVIRTRSTPGGDGGHELVFDDRAGAERVALRSQRLLKVESVGDAVFLHGGSRAESVAGAHDESVGGRSLRKVAGDSVESVGGARSVSVSGADRVDIDGDVIRNVRGNSMERIDGPTVLTQVAGTRQTLIGTGAEGGSDTLGVSKDLRIQAGRTIDLSAREAITLRCGSSTIRMTPDEIVLDAPRVELHGRERARIHHGEDRAVVWQSDGSLALSATKITLATPAGASLVLDAEAKLDGAFVKLNCGRSGAGGRGTALSENPDEAVFRLDPTVTAGDAGTYTFVILAPDGERLEREVAPGGEVRLQGRPGDRFVLDEVRQGERVVQVRRKREP